MRLAAGDSRLATLDWRLATGGWRLAARDWRFAIRDWRLATRDWRLATGDSRPAAGGWRLAIRDWRLATGGLPMLAALARVLRTSADEIPGLSPARTARTTQPAPDRRFLRRLERLHQLSRRQQPLLGTIDAFLGKVS